MQKNNFEKIVSKLKMINEEKEYSSMQDCSYSYSGLAPISVRIIE